MLPRGGDTAEICIICVPVRRGYAFAVNDFIVWRALVQGKPQPQRKDLPVWVEGRDNVYSFGHADHLIFIIQTYVRKINRENSDLDWKLAFSVKGVGNCDLPSQFKELFIIANTGIAYNTFIHVPYVFLTDEWKNFSTSHYVTQSDNSFVGFKATKSLIGLVVAYTNDGTDSSALCNYSVYYR